MKGNTLADFMNDLISAGGPEKEFVFRNTYFVLEAQWERQRQAAELRVDAYDNGTGKDKRFLQSYSFFGKDYAECASQFEKAPLFDGMTIYEAEREVEVLFG